MSNKCRFLHDWGMWEKVSIKPLLTRWHYDQSFQETGTILEQKRVCLRCSFVKLKITTHNI